MLIFILGVCFANSTKNLRFLLGNSAIPGAGLLLLITVKRRGRADCGAGKTFLEFSAGGDQREK
jgi:hypothetical protein